MNNATRAKRIKKVLKLYEKLTGSAEPVDLMTDIRHYCDVKGYDYYRFSNVAYTHYIAEKQE